MAQRIAGICYVKVDGAQYPVRGAWEYSPFTTKKEGIAGLDGIHGYRETPTIPHIKGKITDLGGITVASLQNLTSSTITLEAANGKVIILRDAWVKDEVVVNTEEGSWEVTFEGRDCIEQVGSSQP